MQRKKYFQWIAIALIAILAVVLLFILILKNKKQQNQTTDEPTATPSASPVINASDLPTSPPPASATPIAKPTTTTNHIALARAAYASKQYTTAISEYQKAIDSTTQNGDLATLWNELGNAYRDNQSAAEAVNAYSVAITYNAEHGDAYLNKAAVQWSQGQKDDAIITLESGINKNATRKQDLQNTLDVYKALAQ